MQDERPAACSRKPRIYPMRHRLALFTSMAFVLGTLLGILSGRAQTCTAGGALRLDKAVAPTPINQPPDANTQLRARAKRARRQNFDAANALRIRQIATETANLLILARDLQVQIDKNAGAALPALLIREAEVIELLAHDVQAKMTVTVGAD